MVRECNVKLRKLLSAHKSHVRETSLFTGAEEKRGRETEGEREKERKEEKGLANCITHEYIYILLIPISCEHLLTVYAWHAFTKTFTTLQKQVMRVTRIASVKAHRKSLLLDLDILPFENINKLQVVMFMCKSHMQ